MRIALIGKCTGESWRMESFVQRAFWALGHECYALRIPSIQSLEADLPVYDIPMTLDEQQAWYAEQQQSRLSGIREIDLILIIQGYGLLPSTILDLKARTQRPVVLWHGEVLGDHWPTDDEVVQGKVAQFQPTAWCYDLIIHNCRTSLEMLKDLGAHRAVCVPVSGVDAEIHRRMDLPKAVDIGIFGWPSQRRYELVKEVIEHLPAGVTYAWPDPNDAGSYGEGLMIFLNRCKVVLNTHFSSTLNTETRLYEALGCGTPVVSEHISMPELFPAGHGIRYGTDATVLAAQIEDLLSWDTHEYQGMCDHGYEWVHQRYSYQARCQQVLDAVTKELG